MEVPGSHTIAHVLVYVDDFTLLADAVSDMSWLKGKLSTLFDLKDLGAASQVLGIEVICNCSASTLKLTQRKFIRQLLDEYNMLDCRPLDTPMFANALSALPSPTMPLTDEGRLFMRDKDY
jgi:hypothetical protein